MARVEGFEPASGLLAEAAEPSPEPPPRVDRGRPDQQWREVEALVQGVRETARGRSNVDLLPSRP